MGKVFTVADSREAEGKLELKHFLIAVAGVVLLETILFFRVEQVWGLLQIRGVQTLWMLACMVYFRVPNGFKSPDKKTIYVFLIAAVLSIVAAIFVFMLLPHLVERVSIPSVIHGWYGILLFILIVPIAEELLFRGFLFGFMRQSFSVGVSVGISAVCFALMHGSLLSPQLAGGLIFALGYEYSRNLWVPVFLHIGANAAILLIDQMKLT